MRRIAEYVDRDRLYDMFPWWAPPEIPELESQLRAKLAELEADAKARGWEPKP